MEDVLELEAGYEMLDYEFGSDNDDDSAKNDSSTADPQDQELVNPGARSADDHLAASKSGRRKIKVSRWEMEAGVKPISSGNNPGKADSRKIKVSRWEMEADVKPNTFVINPGNAVSRNAPGKTGLQNAPGKTGSTMLPEKFDSTRKPEKKASWPIIPRKLTSKKIILNLDMELQSER